MNKRHNPVHQTEQTEAALVDREKKEALPKALASHITAERLRPETARDICEELRRQSMSITARRNYDRRSNLGYLNHVLVDPHKPFDMKSFSELTPEDIERLSDEAMALREADVPIDGFFDGDETQVHTFLYRLAVAAQLRFAATPGRPYDKKHDVSFDFGHIDQEADWGAPVRLDGLVAHATNRDALRDSYPAFSPSVVLHDRSHEKLKYEFYESHLKEPVSKIVLRKRPYADVTFRLGSEPTTVKIFRKSWFLLAATNPDFRPMERLIRSAVDGDTGTSSSNRKLADEVGVILSWPDKDTQAYLFPITMTYVASVVDPRYEGGKSI